MEPLLTLWSGSSGDLETRNRPRAKSKVSINQIIVGLGRVGLKAF